MADYIFTMVGSRSSTGPSARCSTTSRSRSCRARRSACSARTAPASRRCCGSWPASRRPRSGSAELAPGATVGLLEQEPELDPAKDVRGNVEDGVRPLRDLLDRFNDDLGGVRRAGRRLRRAARRAGRRCRSRSTGRRLEPRRARSTARWTRCALPDGDRDVTTLSGGERRRVALCRLLLVRAGPAAARRADEPPRRRVGRLARALPRRLRGHRRRGHARPLLPRQRRRLDPRARPRHAGSRTRATTRAGSSRSRRGSRTRRSRSRRGSARSRASSSGCARRRRARHAKSKARLAAYEQLLAEERDVRLDRVEIHIPPGPRLGDLVVEADGVAKGFGDRLLVEDLDVLAAARRHRRRDRPERRRQDDALPDDRRRGAARRGRAAGRRDGRSSPTSTSPAATSTRRAPSGRRSPAATTRSSSAPREVNSRQYVSWFNFRGLRPAEAGRRPLGRRAEPRPPREAAALAAATCCCSTSRRTTSTSTRCARSRTRCSTSPAARS